MDRDHETREQRQGRITAGVLARIRQAEAERGVRQRPTAEQAKRDAERIANGRRAPAGVGR